MMELVGVVLAGGKSTRLGQDKACVLFEGTDLLKRTVHLAEQVCARVLVVGRDPTVHGLTMEWMADDIPGQGPLGGVLTALTRVRSSCLVLTCDLPFLDLPVLRLLLSGWQERERHCLMTTFHHPQTGFIEPLVAVYEPDAAERLRTSLTRGVRKLSRALPASVRHHIPCTEEIAKSFFNINYPADLMLLRELERMRSEAAKKSWRGQCAER